MFYFLYLEDFNIKSKIIIFCLIICLLIPLGAASASDINNTAADDQVLSATPNVDTLSAGVNLEQDNDTLSVQENEILSAGQDSGSNEILGDEQTGSFKDLSTIINTSTTGIIKLDKNYKYNPDTDSDFINGIIVNRTDLQSVSINGIGHIIDGDNKAKIFNIVSDNVILKDIIFQYGYSSTNGGAVLFNGNNGQIMRSSFINNTANNAGALYLLGTSMTITDCTFINNSAATNGAIRISPQCTNTKITKSTFTGNHASNNGAVYAGATDSQVIECTFNNNYATTNKGALCVDGQYSIISNCSFTDNYAVSDCGALYCGAAGLNVSYCTFKFNNASNYGAIQVMIGSNMNVHNLIFINNTATSGYGGAGRFNGDGLNVLNCEFYNNTASTGGAMCISNSNGNTGLVKNCYFENNTASAGSGALYNNMDVTIINNCTFVNSYSKMNAGALYTKYNVFNSTFIDNKAEMSGGALRILSNGFVDNCTFIRNTALQNGGAICTVGNKCSVFNSIFIENNAENGGAIANGYRYFVVNNNTFKSNAASILGGAVYNTGEDFAEIKCKFKDNTAINHTNSMYIKQGITGNFTNTNIDEVNSTDIITKYSELTVNSNDTDEGSLDKVTWNFAINNIVTGGTIYVESGVYYNPTSVSFNQINIKGKGKVIFNFTQTRNGNFITLSQSNSNVENIHFVNYTTSNSNSKVIALAGACKVSDCSFENISCDSVSFFSGRGSTVQNCNFTSNSGISISCAYKVQDVINCKFINNTNLAINANNAQFNIIGCDFINNTCSNGAAAIRTNQPIVHVEKCNFINNTNTLENGRGGAIYNPVDNLDIISCYFYNNTASYGGALYSSAPRYVNIDNCTFIKNNASYGGAVYTTTQTVNILNNSNFYNNSAVDGGAVYSTGDLVNVDCSNFIDNNATNTGGAIYSSGANIVVSDSLFKRNEADEGGAIYSNGTGAKVTGCEFSANKAINGSAICLGNDTTLNIDKSNFNPEPTNYIYKNNDSTITVDVTSVNIDESNIDGSGEAILTKMFVYASPGGTGDGSYDHPASLTDAARIVSPDGEIRLLKGTYNMGTSIDNVLFNLTAWEDNVVFEGTHLSINGENVALKNITFSDVDSDAIVWTKSNGLIENCTFIGANSQQKDKMISVEGTGLTIIASNFTKCYYNSIIYTSVDNIVIKDCIFDLNKAVSNNDYLLDFNGGDVLVELVNFTNNRAKLIKFNPGSGNIVVDCLFINNTDSYADNGLILVNSIAELRNNKFENNTGASVIVLNGTATVKDNNFINNTGVNGSAISTIGGKFTINNNNFTLNNAGIGGAVFLNGGLIIEFNHNNFTANNASVSGGAIYSNIALVMDDVLFKDNNASVSGGAIYLNATGNVLSNADFVNNHALDGGALYLTNGNSLNLVDTSFKDNSHTSSGIQPTRGTIFLGNEAVFGAERFDFPEGQDIYNGTYYATVIYVSVNGGERNLGLTSDSPIRLDQAWDHLKEGFNNKIIFTDDGDYYLAEKLLENQNMTLVGNATIKINSEDKKYLFNHPKKIKNLSLNNYLSTKTQKNKN